MMIRKKSFLTDLRAVQHEIYLLLVVDGLISRIEVVQGRIIDTIVADL